MLKKRAFIITMVISLVLFLQACDSKRQRPEARRSKAIAAAHDQIESALQVLNITDDTDRRFDAANDIWHGLNRLKQFNDNGAAYVEPVAALLGDKEWRVRLLACDMLGRVATAPATHKQRSVYPRL